MDSHHKINLEKCHKLLINFKPTVVCNYKRGMSIEFPRAGQYGLCIFCLEFQTEYTRLATGLSEYVVRLLDKVHSNEELHAILSATAEDHNDITPEDLPRLQLAIKYKEKRVSFSDYVDRFVAGFGSSQLPMYTVGGIYVPLLALF